MRCSGSFGTVGNIGSPAESTAQAPASPCQLALDKTARPARLDLGQVVQLELRVDASCPRAETPLRVVLAIDASSSMEPDGKIQAARELGAEDPAFAAEAEALEARREEAAK